MKENLFPLPITSDALALNATRRINALESVCLLRRKGTKFDIKFKVVQYHKKRRVVFEAQVEDAPAVRLSSYKRLNQYLLAISALEE